MKKLLKKSDKGFSLVELIVVIAIMAVLIGVIAPAFMKYVQKSKTSADNANLDELRKAANTVLADPELVKLNDGKEMEFTISNGVVKTNTVDASGSSETANTFQKLLEAALGGANKYPKAQDNTVGYKITVTGNYTDGYSAEVVETGRPTPTATTK